VNYTKNTYNLSRHYVANGYFLYSQQNQNNIKTHNKTFFSTLTLLVGRQEWHPACKELDVGLLTVTLWLELCTCYSS